MSWWSSNQSNMINGTDGSVFHPLLSRKELLYIFAADLCRYVTVISPNLVLSVVYDLLTVKVESTKRGSGLGDSQEFLETTDSYPSQTDKTTVEDVTP